MTAILLTGVAVVDFVFKVDEMPRRAEKYRSSDAFIAGGGNAANAAVAIARLGGSPSLAARIGADSVGDMIIEELNNNGVDTALVNRAKGGMSSFSSIYIDKAGERQIMNFRGAGLAENADWLSPKTRFCAVLSDNRWGPVTRRAIEIARAQNIPCVIDCEAPAELDMVQGATHLAFAMQALRELAGERDIETALNAIADETGAFVCVTDGENGVHYLDGKAMKTIGGFAVNVVDTLGAGDIWHGAFTLSIAEGKAQEDAILFANAAAALKCTRSGGRNGCPTRTETDNFLKENRICN